MTDTKERVDRILEGRPVDQGRCYRCGKPLGTIVPVLLQLARRPSGHLERKKLCTDCFIAVFDSVTPLEAEERGKRPT